MLRNITIILALILMITSTVACESSDENQPPLNTIPPSVTEIVAPIADSTPVPIPVSSPAPTDSPVSPVAADPTPAGRTVTPVPQPTPQGKEFFLRMESPTNDNLRTAVSNPSP